MKPSNSFSPKVASFCDNAPFVSLLKAGEENVPGSLSASRKHVMAAKVGSPGAAMDAEFLKRTVGEPLSEALTSLVVAQPADPIEFVGEALLDYIKRREAELQVKHRCFVCCRHSCCDHCFSCYWCCIVFEPARAVSTSFLSGFICTKVSNTICKIGAPQMRKQ